MGYIPEFTADMDIIQKLDDEPNDVGGLTASELKAKFDEAGNTIKAWINGEFIQPANMILIRAEAAAEDAEQHTADQINSWLDAHPEATTTVQDGAITANKLAAGAVTADKLGRDANPNMPMADVQLFGLTVTGTRNDAAVYGNNLFWFTGKNKKYYVYDLVTTQEIYAGTLIETVNPHGNAVSFGVKASDTDPFPPIYVTGYNGDDNGVALPWGTCFVYSVDAAYGLQLVQRIAIDSDFLNSEMWKGDGISRVGIIKYGNFVVDTDKNKLYVFTCMKNGAKGMTRVFVFDIPDLGVSSVTLTASDVLAYYDLPLYRWVQGATCHEGKLYISCGNAALVDNSPGLAIVDLNAFIQVGYVPLREYMLEPEMVVAYNGAILVGKHDVYSLRDISVYSNLGRLRDYGGTMYCTDMETLAITATWQDRTVIDLEPDDSFVSSTFAARAYDLSVNFMYFAINIYCPHLTERTLIMTLPDQLLPAQKINQMLIGQGGSVFLMEIESTGGIYLTKTYSATTSSEFIRHTFFLPKKVDWE